MASSPIKPIATPTINPAATAVLNPTGGPTALSPSNPTVVTTTATAAVTVPNTSGSVTFQLVVTDNLGVASAPATVTIKIQGAPTAVLSGTPNPVAAGKTITLSGQGSSAADPGTIASYAYTLVTPTAANPIT